MPLSVLFLLGLDENIIRCSNPACNFTLVELVNLILYLNCSNLEVEEVKENLTRSHTAPSEKHVASPAHSPPVPSTYLSNGSVSSAPPVFPRARKWASDSTDLGAKIVDSCPVSAEICHPTHFQLLEPFRSSAQNRRLPLTQARWPLPSQARWPPHSPLTKGGG